MRCSELPSVACVTCTADALPGRLLCATCKAHAQELETLRLTLPRYGRRVGMVAALAIALCSCSPTPEQRVKFAADVIKAAPAACLVYSANPKAHTPEGDALCAAIVRPCGAQ